MRDVASAKYYADFGICVDTSEWLAKTSVCRCVPFNTNIKEEGEAEDGAWQTALLAAGSKVGCTEMATLLYRLGGHSNVCKVSTSELFNPIMIHSEYDEETLERMRTMQKLILEGHE
jgi:hypothetical protein